MPTGSQVQGTMDTDEFVPNSWASVVAWRQLQQGKEVYPDLRDFVMNVITAGR